jgi:hypothetical protein
MINYNKKPSKKQIQNPTYAIINLHNHNQPGSHWVAFFNSIKENKVCYFDSFGIYPSDIILKFLRLYNKQIVFNNSQLQAIDSIKCGYFCKYFIDNMKQGLTFKEVLYNELKQSPNEINEAIVSTFEIKSR